MRFVQAPLGYLALIVLLAGCTRDKTGCQVVAQFDVSHFDGDACFGPPDSSTED